MTVKRIFRVLIFLALTTGASSGAEEISDSSNTGDLLADKNVQGAIAITDAWLETLYAFRDLPSMSVGFVVDQELIFAKSYGYQQTLYPADTLFQYSNLGITLVGEIVSQNSGMPYEEYVTTEILEPLGLTDTRPRFPEELHGKQMAIGYSGRGRDLKRKPVKPFHTRAIAPAAGFTSTVNDLAKFASWNFRTLEGEANEVLAPNTLREMQRVHWVNPDWKTTWGLGFVVSKGKDGNQVGHSGGCPGFITNFAMVPKNKTAAIALTSATDGPAHLATKAMLENIGKAAKGAKKTSSANEPDSENDEPDLAEFSGNYGGTVWGGETLIRVWDKQLAIARAPSDNLRVEKLKHVEGDKFLRITAEKEEREHWHFQRDEDGSVVSVKIHGSIAQKLL